MDASMFNVFEGDQVAIWVKFEEKHVMNRKSVKLVTSMECILIRLYIKGLHCWYYTEQNWGHTANQVIIFIMSFTFISELQIRGGIEDKSKIIFLIPQQKHSLWPLIRAVSARRF